MPWCANDFLCARAYTHTHTNVLHRIFCLNIYNCLWISRICLFSCDGICISWHIINTQLVRLSEQSCTFYTLFFSSLKIMFYICLSYFTCKKCLQHKHGLNFFFLWYYRIKCLIFLNVWFQYNPNSKCHKIFI